MKILKLLSIILVSSFLLISCGKKSKLGKIIPKQAALVVDLNTKSLLSKLSWEEIKKTNWYNELMSDTSIPAASKIFIGDPGKTGIDLSADIVFFLLKADSSGQAVVEGSLKDSKAFADFIKNMHPETAATKDGELNIFKTKDAVIGWNDDRFIFVSGSKHEMFNMPMPDSLDPNITTPLPPAGTEDLVKVCKDLFSLSSDNSLYNNERFASMTDEEGDVHLWINSGEMYKGNMQGMPGMAGMVKLDKFLDDNVSASTINFENGKITGTSKQYFGKELSDILKKGDGDINTDMVKRLSAQTAAVMAFHFTPGNILEIIKLTGLDGFINLMLTQQGISLDDIVKATTGDIVFSVGDISVKTDTSAKSGVVKNDTGYMRSTPDATFFFAVGIGNKDAFNKVVNAVRNLAKGAGPKSLLTKTDDKYFVATNSQDAINKYYSGAASTPAYLDKISGHPIGWYVDVQMILKGLQPELTKDSVGNFYYSKNIAMWNNVYFTGGEYKNGALVSSGEVNLIDKNTNSLKQLNQFADDIYKVARQQRKKRMEEWKRSDSSIDSTVSTKQKPAVK